MLRSLWLTRLSKPAAERILYRHVLASRPGRILELGLGMLARTERLLEAAAAGVAEVAYVGIDRFESRTLQDPPGVSLKEAHRRLHDRAKVQLVPGNVDSALARTCNHLGVFDLVVISADNDQRHLPRCWFFLQRVTRPQSTVFVESGTAWTTVSREKIDDLASRSVLQRAG